MTFRDSPGFSGTHVWFRRSVILLAFVAMTALLPTVGHAADKASPSLEERLRPSGLEGAVILDTNDRPGEATVVRFLKLAKGDEGRLTALVVGEARAEGILDLLKAKKPARWKS